jgi:hypothetical protein
MATLQADPNDIEPDPQPHDLAVSNSRSYLDRIKNRLARIPTTPSFIASRTLSSEQGPPASVTRTSTATTGSGSRLSTSTAATSVSSLPPSFLVQGFHISPSMPVNDEMQSIWTQQIKSHLRAVLLHEIPTGTCVQEFMMAGKRPDALKPAVVVSCGDVVTKKRVENTFKGQVWLQELLKKNGIMFIVVIAKTRLSMGQTLDPLRTRSQKVTDDGDNLERGISASLVSLEDEEEDDAPFSIRSPNLGERPESKSVSAPNASDIRRSPDIRASYGTVSTNSQWPLNTPTAVAPSSSATSASPPPQNTIINQPLNRSWIAGPIIGSILGMATVATVIYFTRWKLRRDAQAMSVDVKKSKDLEDNDSGDSTPSTRGKSQLHSENVPARELGTNEVYELAAVDPVGSELTTPRGRVAEDWPLPIFPLSSIFVMTETQDERAGNNNDAGNRRKIAQTLNAIGNYSSASTLKVQEACSVLHPGGLTSTACGLHLLLNTSDPQKQRHCTLGGLIVVNGAIFGLTAGHPFKDRFANSSKHDRKDATVPESNFGEQDDDEPFVFNDGDASSLESLSGPTAASSDNHSYSSSRSVDHSDGEYSIPANPPTRNSPPYSVTIPISVPKTSLTSENTPEYLDWGLLETLPLSVSQLPNKITRIDPRYDTFVEGIISTPLQGEVAILISGNGAKVGCLHSSPVTMKVNESVLEVRLITLEQVLRESPPPLLCYSGIPLTFSTRPWMLWRMGSF